MSRQIVLPYSQGICIIFMTFQRLKTIYIWKEISEKTGRLKKLKLSKGRAKSFYDVKRQ